MNDTLLEAMSFDELRHYLSCTPVSRDTRNGLLVNLLLERYQEYIDSTLPDYEVRIRILEDKLDEALSENTDLIFQNSELEQKVWELENS